MHSFLQRLGQAALVLGACCALAGQARGDLTLQSIGGPIEAESWLQAFQVVRDTPFNHLGLAIWPVGATEGFKEPAWDFSLGNPHGFSGGAVNPGVFGTQWTVATGNATLGLLWQSHFAGAEDRQSFLLTLFAFDDNLNWDAATAYWNGKTWDFGPRTSGISWDEFVRSGGVAGVMHVPVPPAVLLGILGLGLVGVIPRRLA